MIFNNPMMHLRIEPYSHMYHKNLQNIEWKPNIHNPTLKHLVEKLNYFMDAFIVIYLLRIGGKDSVEKLPTLFLIYYPVDFQTFYFDDVVLA